MNTTIPVLFLIYMEEVIALYFILPVVQEEIQCSVLQVKVSMNYHIYYLLPYDNYDDVRH